MNSVPSSGSSSEEDELDMTDHEMDTLAPNMSDNHVPIMSSISNLEIKQEPISQNGEKIEESNILSAGGKKAAHIMNSAPSSGSSSEEDESDMTDHEMDTLAPNMSNNHVPIMSSISDIEMKQEPISADEEEMEESNSSSDELVELEDVIEAAIKSGIEDQNNAPVEQLDAESESCDFNDYYPRYTWPSYYNAPVRPTSWNQFMLQRKRERARMAERQEMEASSSSSSSS